MIRDFELFCNLNRIHFDDFSLLSGALHSFKPSTIICPGCGAEHSCSRHASYQRDFICCSSHQVQVHTINIPRLICSSCGHTHAFLPALLVPHASYSLFFILKVLRSYFLNTDTVVNLCRNAAISVSTLYHWLHLFSLHKQLWLGLLKDHSYSKPDFLKAVMRQPLFFGRFFLSFRFSFLQSSPRRRIITASMP